MKLYFDSCCYNRPYDNIAHLVQESVRYEIAAIRGVVRICGMAGIPIMGSPAVVYEIGKISNNAKLEKVWGFYNRAISQQIKFSADIFARVQELTAMGLKGMDSYHTAFAEAANVDFLLTTDDRFERSAKRLILNVMVINPTKFLPEVIRWVRQSLT